MIGALKVKMPKITLAQDGWGIMIVFSLFFQKDICYGYSLEASQRDNLKEHHKEWASPGDFRTYHISEQGKLMSLRKS